MTLAGCCQIARISPNLKNRLKYISIARRVPIAPALLILGDEIANLATLMQPGVPVERGDQEGTVSPNWLSTLELWRHLYTGNEKSFVRKDLPTNFKSHFQGFACNGEETF